jgi:hypothetical protein
MLKETMRTHGGLAGHRLPFLLLGLSAVMVRKKR